MKLFNKKKELIEIGFIILALAAILVIVVMKSNESTVQFQTISDEKLPRKIVTEVIPNYRTEERALACTIDDQIYVFVSRGKKRQMVMM